MVIVANSFPAINDMTEPEAYPVVAAAAQVSARQNQAPVAAVLFWVGPVRWTDVGASRGNE